MYLWEEYSYTVTCSCHMVRTGTSDNSGLSLVVFWHVPPAMLWYYICGISFNLLMLCICVMIYMAMIWMLIFFLSVPSIFTPTPVTHHHVSLDWYPRPLRLSHYPWLIVTWRRLYLYTTSYDSLPISTSQYSQYVTIRPGRTLVSAVMTTRPESRISHGLFIVRSWLTD
jgi:hypothetical protein